MELADLVSKEDVRNLVWTVFSPKPGENIIILNDFPDKEAGKEIEPDFLKRKQMAEDWHQVFSEEGRKHGFSVEPVITYFPTGKSGASLPDTAVQDSKKISLLQKFGALSRRDIILAITKYSATAHLFPYTERTDGCRVASMPGAQMNMSAFKADYALVRKKSEKLASILSEAELGIVEFSTGHRCFFDLRNGKTHADNGDCSQPGRAINLPSGEAFKIPYENRGKGEDLGESRTKGQLPQIIDGKLIIYEVKDNRIVGVAGDYQTASELGAYFKEDPARANIAEFGNGCNDLAVPTGAVLQDEKITGFHWAYGRSDHIGGKVGVGDFLFPQKAVHQDIVYGKGLSIGIDKLDLFNRSGERIEFMRQNQYLVSFG